MLHCSTRFFCYGLDFSVQPASYRCNCFISLSPTPDYFVKPFLVIVLLFPLCSFFILHPLNCVFSSLSSFTVYQACLCVPFTDCCCRHTVSSSLRQIFLHFLLAFVLCQATSDVLCQLQCRKLLSFASYFHYFKFCLILLLLSIFQLGDFIFS